MLYNFWNPNQKEFKSSVTSSSLLGVDKVIQYAVTEWLTDIRKNQLPGILGGVGPMHSVVQLCKFILQHQTCCQLNIYTLVFLLFSHLSRMFFYSPRSEGSVLAAHRAVQEGWTHYPRSPKGGSVLRHLNCLSCSGAQQQAGAGHSGRQDLDFGTADGETLTGWWISIILFFHFCPCLKATAETVYDILSPTPPLTRYAITEGRTLTSRPRRAAQPADLREGVAKAYDTVREVHSYTFCLECISNFWSSSVLL